MPSTEILALLKALPACNEIARRLSRRHFSPLAKAPLHQGRMGEFVRLLLRVMGRGSERLSYQANDWLMQTMVEEIEHTSATAVHSYEDCSLWQFEKAKQKGLACIYDLPIGYYPVWQETEEQLMRKYADWLPAGQRSNPYVRPEQKKAELELADLVLAPSTFVEKTVRRHYPGKQIALAPYGVDVEFWTPDSKKKGEGPLTFIYAGQNSLRKGTPDLLQAWSRAALKDARLRLIGSWQLSEQRLRDLPPGVEWHPSCSAEQLRKQYRDGDVFVFPSYFEGFGLVLLEAMACGLPAISSDASAMADIYSGTEGRVFAAGDLDALVEALQWASNHRDLLLGMGLDARNRAQLCTWRSYRKHVQDAVAPLL
jgi:alpha-maltose-1-phosphate synthase